LRAFQAKLPTTVVTTGRASFSYEFVINITAPIEIDDSTRTFASGSCTKIAQ